MKNVVSALPVFRSRHIRMPSKSGTDISSIRTTAQEVAWMMASTHGNATARTTTDSEPIRTPSHTSFAKQRHDAEEEDRAGLLFHAPSPSAFKAMAKQVVPWIQGKRQELQGWRFGVSRSAWLATAVLFLNTLVTIAAVIEFGSEDGIGTAYMVSLKGYTIRTSACAHKP